MFVSYRKLNVVTKPFEFPVPRCDDAITIIGTGSHYISIISLNARQGYHQVQVRKKDKEKISFLLSRWVEVYFKSNAIRAHKYSCIYSIMIKAIKDEWDNLFLSRM